MSINTIETTFIIANVTLAIAIAIYSVLEVRLQRS